MAISHAPAVAVTTPRTSRTRRRVLFFGTYDARRYPRVRVLREGFAALGDDVLECNVPLRLNTAARVRMLRRPWLVPVLAAKVAATWIRLIFGARRYRGVDLVVVGYMGHFDVHLARLLWPRTPVALDHLVSARDTALDRRASARWLVWLLHRLDPAAGNAAPPPRVATPPHPERAPRPAPTAGPPRPLPPRAGPPPRAGTASPPPPASPPSPPPWAPRLPGSPRRSATSTSSSG